MALPWSLSTCMLCGMPTPITGAGADVYLQDLLICEGWATQCSTSTGMSCLFLRIQGLRVVRSLKVHRWVNVDSPRIRSCNPGPFIHLKIPRGVWGRDIFTDRQVHVCVHTHTENVTILGIRKIQMKNSWTHSLSTNLIPSFSFQSLLQQSDSLRLQCLELSSPGTLTLSLFQSCFIYLWLSLSKPLLHPWANTLFWELVDCSLDCLATKMTGPWYL